MNLLRKLGALICCAMVFSCVSMQPRYQEIQLPPARIYQKGYLFVPLNEKGWSIGQRNQYDVVIGKRGEGKDEDETYVVWGSLIKLSPYKDSQDLVRIVKEAQAEDVNPQRFKLITHEVSYQEERGADCAKSHALSEDTAAVKKSGRSGDMMLEILTLTCAHPKNKSIGINLAYSHRYFPEQKDPNFIEKATSVLSSIEFDDL